MLIKMLLRLLTLILLLISTSCCKEQQDIEVRNFNVLGQKATLNDDSDDYDVIRDYCCLGIIGENEASTLRTSESQRTSQRNFEKRKLTSDARARGSIVNKTFKLFCINRQTYCHYEKSGRSLLHFLCKLSI
jgi:hypothetical protein